MELFHKFWHLPFVWLKHLIKGPAVTALGIFFLLVGIIFLGIRQWSFWVIGIGIPAITIGVSFVLYGIYDLIFGIFSPRHSLIDCPFCGTKVKIKIFYPKKCTNCGQELKK